MTLSSDLCEIGIEVRKRITTIGTEDCETTLPMLNEDDFYRMHIKYENRSIFVKDSGAGFGVFLLKEAQ